MLAAHMVLVTTGSAGDLFPFLRLGVELKQRGYPVTLVAPFLHEEAVRRAGLEFHATQADPAVLDDPDLWHPRKGFAVVWKAVLPGLRELPSIVAHLPPSERCIILAHPLALPHAELCRSLRAGVKVVAAYLAPSNIPTVYDPLVLGPLEVPRWVPLAVRRWLWRRIGAALIDPVALPGINADRQEFGLAPVTRLFDHLRTLPDLSLTLFPDWFGARQPDWPAPLAQGDFTLYDPEADARFPTAVMEFLQAGPAPFVFTHGTGNRQAALFFSCALAATHALGRRAIVLTPHREQLPAQLPANVLWQPYLALAALLPQAAALVHHGGIGTTAEALRAGVPQLIVPLAFDQFDNAARVCALGVGLSLRARRMSSARIADALARLTSSAAIARCCSSVAAGMREAQSIEKMIDAIVEGAHDMYAIEQKN
ncbi:MAG: glycosyltransferase [Pseudomonadota bacterium]